MKNKELYPEAISRDEINDAMRRFLDKGGKIDQIEPQHHVGHSSISDIFENNDATSGEVLQYIKVPQTHT